ncbi:MAG TPA: squalene--hopene cyclase [Alphaproteobacteria bacterium]|nr:squalene--hopene cyclase [Alphaproteobacteria bacterium]
MMPDEAVASSALAPNLAPELPAELDPLIEDARAELEAIQNEDGHWVFELEADVTIPAEYIMLGHFLDEIDQGVDAKLAAYIRRIQGAHGGWPLFHDGDFDISASVKGYYALKLAGDDPDAPHMAKARGAIRAHGGAATANVFTRFALALFGQVPWRACPVMLVEIMLLPRWFPFHLSKVSYWSRTVIVPLLILMALKPRAVNPRGVHIRELFLTPPEDEKNYLSKAIDTKTGGFFLYIDKVLRRIEPRFSKSRRERAIAAAVKFITERLNGEEGLGAIFPAMANTVMAFAALGYAKDHPDLVIAKKSIEKLLILKEDEGYCQPCVSPIWDTSLAVHAVMEAGAERTSTTVRMANAWMAERQITEVVGDWAWQRPGLAPGGWAFQYANDYYPDVDDTAVVGMALDRAGDPAHRRAIDRAAAWIDGMQSRNGGWGAFDIDNNHDYLNAIPFADHGALLDPPTEDVSARCVSFLLQIGRKADDPVVSRGFAYLRRTQQPDGSWFGRWGTNYIYGTWSVLCAFNAAGIGMEDAAVARAAAWLKTCQRGDGGWGEDGATYWEGRRAEAKESTPSQTAWALLALMAAGEVESDAVKRGIAYLITAEREGARWKEDAYTAVGFPRVFYLRYHGYAAFFPLWALARYRNLKLGNDRTTAYGI